MAKTLGVFKNWSGKVGDIVYSKWKSLQNVRAYTIPTDPETPAQVAQRSKIVELTAAFNGIRISEIEKIWKTNNRPTNTGWNNFFSKNLRLGTIPGFDELVLSKGSLERIILIDFTYNPISGLATVEFHQAGSVNGNGIDDVIIIIMHDLSMLFYSSGDVIRSDGTVNLDIGPGISSGTLYCFCFAKANRIWNYKSHLVFSDDTRKTINL